MYSVFLVSIRIVWGDEAASRMFFKELKLYDFVSDRWKLVYLWHEVFLSWRGLRSVHIRKWDLYLVESERRDFVFALVGIQWYTELLLLRLLKLTFAFRELVLTVWLVPATELYSKRRKRFFFCINKIFNLVIIGFELVKSPDDFVIGADVDSSLVFFISDPLVGAPLQ